MKVDATLLLKDYFYVHNIIMSAPLEICKIAFHPNNPPEDFCVKYCCFPSVNNFILICNHFNVSKSEEQIRTWNICTRNEEHHIKNFNKGAIDYLSHVTPINDITNIKEKREQITIYFWLFVYIFWGPENNNRFFNLLHDELPPLTDRDLSSLISKFCSFSQLTGIDNKTSHQKEVYDMIKTYSQANSSFSKKSIDIAEKLKSKLNR